MCILHLAAIDPSLGKVHKASLSHETRMELLVEKFENKHLICDLNDHKNIGEWTGVTVNERQEVIRLIWSYHDIGGSLDMEWLPLTTKISRHGLQECQLKGSIEIKNCPEPLTIPNLDEKEVSGSVVLTPQASSITQFIEEYAVRHSGSYTTPGENFRTLSLRERLRRENGFLKLPAGRDY
mmetsp:Transcript_32690/g.51092  ORF Transcript_32690/g.51092 Transcript_32690/m.51092 type:complete len:181 (-) Transcript_32690:142-684(-)